MTEFAIEDYPISFSGEHFGFLLQCALTQYVTFSGLPGGIYFKIVLITFKALHVQVYSRAIDTL